MPHPVVRIDQRGGLALFDDLHLRIRELDTGLDTVVVVLEAPHPVRFNAASIRRDQNIGADPGILIGDPLRLEHIHHEPLDNVNRNSFNFVCHSFHPL